MTPSDDPRRRSRRAGSALALAAALALAVAPRAAGAVSAGEVADVAFDVVVLRPLNATAVVLGAVFFVGSAPFVAPFEGREGVETAWDIFVYAPWEYAVLRDLGEFS